MSIGEKVAYLKGLAEGIEISSNTKEGRLLKGMLDILSDISESLKNLDDEHENLAVYAEELDKDLGNLEKAFIKSKSASDFEDGDLYGEGEDEDEEYEDFGDLEGCAKINCPSCGELILFDFEDFEDESYIDCPKCGVEISVVSRISSDGCDCGGCHGHSHSRGHEHDAGSGMETEAEILE